MQLLMLTGLGFWLLINKLGGEATITLDTDWFYRRPSQLAYRLCVISLSHLFATVESLTTRFACTLARASTNPVGYFIEAIGSVQCVLSGAKQPNPKPTCKPFNPDRYRLPLGVMALVVLLFFVIIIVWRLLASWH